MKKRLFLLLFIWSAFNAVASAQTKGDGGHAIILQYHRFGESRYPSTDIAVDLFKKQMAYLHDNHYNVVPLSLVVEDLIHKKPLPQKTVVITMDDAYRTVYTNAYPILKKYNFPATIFVNSLPVIHHSKRYMTWNEMREMGKNGAEFANHTYSHEYLVRIDADKPLEYKKDVTKEIVKCEKKLQKELGKYLCSKPKMLAYPFGEFDIRLMKIIKKLGYIGIAQNSGPVSQRSNLLALTRFPMSASFGKMPSFILKLHTLPLAVRSTSTEDTMVTKENNPPVFRLKLEKKYKDLQCFTSNGKKIDMKWLSDKEVQMQSEVLLQYPRDHYTCTAWAAKGRWYWFSHMWVVQKEK